VTIKTILQAAQILFIYRDSRDAECHRCLFIVIHLMKGEWMEDTDAGQNSTFCLLVTVYFSQNSNSNLNCNNYSDNKV